MGKGQSRFLRCLRRRLDVRVSICQMLYLSNTEHQIFPPLSEHHNSVVSVDSV